MTPESEVVQLDTKAPEPSWSPGMSIFSSTDWGSGVVVGGGDVKGWYCPAGYLPFYANHVDYILYLPAEDDKPICKPDKTGSDE